MAHVSIAPLVLKSVNRLPTHGVKNSVVEPVTSADGTHVAVDGDSLKSSQNSGVGGGGFPPTIMDVVVSAWPMVRVLVCAVATIAPLVPI